MFDAYGRIPQAITQGNRYDLGSYDQCININEVVEDVKIKGRYCTAGLVLDLPETTSPGLISVCLPNACYPSDFFGNNNSSDEYCQTKNESRILEAEDIALM